MKKHYFYNMLTILMVALTSFSFASCGDDDDDEQGGGSGSQNVLVGSWRQEEGSDYITWTFNNDGTGSQLGVSGRNDGAPLTWNDKFTYRIVEYYPNGQIGDFIFSWDYAPSKTYTLHFEIDGNILYIGGGWGYFTKQ